MRYLDIEFSPDFLSAKKDGDERKISFTRQERILLRHFTANNMRLLQRNDLLAVIDGENTAAGDRHIDFLVNKLRRNLGDSARNPRFIRTQYGEGYIWIAEKSDPDKDDTACFMCIGPVYGLERGGEEAEHCVSQLRDELQAGLGAEKSVTLSHGKERPDCEFTLEVHIHRYHSTLHMALILQRDGEIIAIERLDRQHHSNNTGADTIIQNIWTYLALPPAGNGRPGDTPIWIRQHDAALLLSTGQSGVSWRENARKLQRAKHSAPEDKRLDIMWGLNLYVRLLQSMSERDEWLSQKEWDSIEHEIEDICLARLPGLSEIPEMKLATAKLMIFINRGHTDRAELLINEALQKSASFATIASLRGQISANRGHIREACALYDEAITLSDPGSEFYIYLHVLKAAAFRAGAQHEELATLSAMFRQHLPVAHQQLKMLLEPDFEIDPSEPIWNGTELTSTTAQSMLQHLFRIFGRHFEHRRHRKNIMDRPIQILTGLFSESVVSDEIRASICRA